MLEKGLNLDIAKYRIYSDLDIDHYLRFWPPSVRRNVAYSILEKRLWVKPGPLVKLISNSEALYCPN